MQPTSRNAKGASHAQLIPSRLSASLVIPQTAKSTETMTEKIAHENFSGHLNALFRVDVAETSLELELVEVEVHKSIDPLLREPFTLIFQGPKDSILAEGTYNVSNDGAGSFELYIIPIVSLGEQQSYQVIFN